MSEPKLKPAYDPKDVLDVLVKKFKAQLLPTGSRFVCDPPVMNTDEDWLVLVPYVDADTAVSVMEEMANFGFSWEGDNEHYQDVLANRFTSFRHSPYNVLITFNEDFWNKHCLATALCKKLNLPSKEDRKRVFRAILYSEAPQA